MALNGEHLIGSETSRDGGDEFRAVNPESGAALEPAYCEATTGEIDRALQLAATASRALRQQPRIVRAELLERIATGLEELGDTLVERVTAETALPRARVEMERGRTANQLRMFAELVRGGSFVDARIDHGDPNRAPIPKPDVRQMMIGLGPVVVFGASNFPLAFSVAGGDTASALAAGCPVVAKAHPHHPGTSELVGRVIVDAVRAVGLPSGTFSLVHGRTHDVGLALVRHPLAAAVGFTGSFGGGKALFDAAAARPDPIPVFAEMGSTNPVYLLPGALAERTDDLAAGLAQSVTLGVGQFCTNPGLVITLQGDATDRLVADLGARLAEAPAGTTLHGGIAQAYRDSVSRLAALEGVEHIGRTDAASGRVDPALLTTDAATFLAHAELREEVFGPSTVVVRCPSADSVMELTRTLPGQLTATVHATPADLDAFTALIRELEDKVGRIVFDGYPTGVEVGPAMHHGGPFPATTDARSTSVGTAAVRRFLRPICYQNCPASQLPPELADDNPTGIDRLVDGELGRA